MPGIDGGTPGGLPGPSYPATPTGEILGNAAQQLQDITGRRWGQNSVLVPYLNLAILEILNLKPEALAITTTITLVAGAVQGIATTDIALIDVVCNMASGDIRGRVITHLDKAQMDSVFPEWMVSYPLGTANLEVYHAVIDGRDPKKFYVFPPQPDPTSQNLEAIICTPPTEMSTVDDIFPLDDSYIPAAIDYVVYRALAEETTIQNALSKATMFYQKFLQDLGIKTAVESKTEARGK